MVLENTSLFINIDQAVHQLAERLIDYKNNDFLIVVLSNDAMPVAEQIARRLGIDITFSAMERNTEIIDSLNAMSVVSFDYNTINDSNRDIPQDFIFHQEQNFRANLISIYADSYKSIASKFPGKVVILADELANNGDEFFPSLTRNLTHQPERINLAVSEITPEGAFNNSKRNKRFVFLHAGNSINATYQGFDMIVENMLSI